MEEARLNLRKSNEFMSSLRNNSGSASKKSPLPSSSKSKRKKTPASRERVSKMREIKGEIGQLMNKIEDASKQIYESFINKKHEYVLKSRS